LRDAKTAIAQELREAHGHYRCMRRLRWDGTLLPLPQMTDVVDFGKYHHVIFTDSCAAWHFIGTATFEIWYHATR